MSTPATRQPPGERSRVPADRTDQLKIKEIFFSLQGESTTTGWPTVFVRLTGCPLRCTYCDTEYAFFGGQWMSFGRILDTVAGHGARHVCVTGGEPLAQQRCLELLTRLCDAGYEVSLETSGAVDVSAVDPRVMKVVDVKTPASGEVDRNRWDNLQHLSGADQLKFVVCDRADYEWTRQTLAERPIPAGITVFLSPAHGSQDPRELAEWILSDGLDVRFQVQLHKILWGEEPGR